MTSEYYPVAEPVHWEDGEVVSATMSQGRADATVERDERLQATEVHIRLLMSDLARNPLKRPEVRKAVEAGFARTNRRWAFEIEEALQQRDPFGVTPDQLMRLAAGDPVAFDRGAMWHRGLRWGTVPMDSTTADLLIAMYAPGLAKH